MAAHCHLKTDDEPINYVEDGSIDVLFCNIDWDCADLALKYVESTGSMLNIDDETVNSSEIQGIGNESLVKSNFSICHRTEKKKHSVKKHVMKKGQRYLPDFKRKVLNYAVKHTFRETASKFNVNCNTLTEWAREYKRLLLLKKSTTRPGISTKTDETGILLKTDQTDCHSNIPYTKLQNETEFFLWLKKKRLEGCRLDRGQLHLVGLSILQSNHNTSEWFATWVNRLAEDPSNRGKLKTDNGVRKAETHISYPDPFKIEVALYSEMYTKKHAAVTFGVSSRRVYEWCDRLEQPAKLESSRTLAEQKLLKWYQQRCAQGSRPKSLEIMSNARVFYAECGLPHIKCSHGWLDKARKRLDLKLGYAGDDDLLLWVLTQLDNNSSLSHVDVTDKARELAISSGDTQFKGSKGWTLRFLKRHSHLLQGTSAQLSDLPPIAAAKAQSFCLSLQQRVGAASLQEASIGCMDEVPINFAYPTETVHTPPLLRKANLDRAHAVILLAATSDGRLLPPAVVLKGPPSIQTFNFEESSVVVLRYATGCVDTQALRDWARHVWLSCVKAPSLLVVDSFTPHLDMSVEKELSGGYCHLAIIPPGCAVNLQPCAFNLSRRFKEVIQDEWIKYATGTTLPSWRTNVGPDENNILIWVVRAYQALRQDVYSIRCSFHLTGLTKPADQVIPSELVT